MKDLFDKIKTHLGPIGEHAQSAHGYFTFPKLEGEINPHMRFRGKTQLNWSLNNYLGLANHPEVRETDAKASEQFGLAQIQIIMNSLNVNFLSLFKRRTVYYVISVIRPW